MKRRVGGTRPGCWKGIQGHTLRKGMKLVREGRGTRVGTTGAVPTEESGEYN